MWNKKSPSLAMSTERTRFRCASLSLCRAAPSLTCQLASQLAIAAASRGPPRPARISTWRPSTPSASGSPGVPEPTMILLLEGRKGRGTTSGHIVRPGPGRPIYRWVTKNDWDIFQTQPGLAPVIVVPQVAKVHVISHTLLVNIQ